MTENIALWPEAASTTAVQVDQLFFFLLAVCGAVSALVAFLLVYFCIRYRRRPGEKGTPPPSAQPRALEWFWTLSPLVIFMGMFVWGGQVYFRAFRGPDNAPVVYVVGKQWMWKFQHPEGQREINTLHVPVNRPTKLVMTSEDVIHSLFIPAFRIHMDLLPERYTSVWFQPTRTGRFRLFCSEYCGTNHAGMVGEVIVMEPEEYQRWLQYSAEGSLAWQGRKIFLKYRCLSCHSADGTNRAPLLENLFGRRVQLQDGRRVIADEGYIRESILYPSAKIVAGYANIMPTFKGEINEEEILALIAYIQSLEGGQTPPRVEDFPPPTTTPPIGDNQTSSKP
jgi:cytochrome c oxidase subunit 2